MYFLEKNVKRFSLLNILLCATFSLPLTANAGDFDWLNNLNIKAEADASSFQVTLATRFRIGNAEVEAVISNADRPSDAYMILRLGELSNRPVEEVIKVYQADRDKGWGVMAKNLGIKPGSREFHALKRGHDLDDAGSGQGQADEKSKGKGKSKNKKKG